MPISPRSFAPQQKSAPSDRTALQGPVTTLATFNFANGLLPYSLVRDATGNLFGVTQYGVHRVFDRTSGVSLVDAVAASCAVPGIWPPVTIQGARYVDGGVRSSDNADLASGFARVIVVSPLGLNSMAVTQSVCFLIS